MNIGIVGLGKLGLPVALAIESKGHKVFGYDVDKNVHETINKKKIKYKEKDANKLLKKSKCKLIPNIFIRIIREISFVKYVNNFLNLIVAIFRGLWFNTLKMNEEQTFQFGPFEVTVFPATNEEDEWVEVEDCE